MLCIGYGSHVKWEVTETTTTDSSGFSSISYSLKNLINKKWTICVDPGAKTSNGAIKNVTIFDEHKGGHKAGPAGGICIVG